MYLNRTNKHKVTLHVIKREKSNVLKLNIMIYCPFVDVVALIVTLLLRKLNHFLNNLIFCYSFNVYV